jgi:hypothetical protein
LNKKGGSSRNDEGNVRDKLYTTLLRWKNFLLKKCRERLYEAS